jgi:adenylate kinase
MKYIYAFFIGLFFTGSVIAEEKSPKVVILLGAPASGKGTQAKFITKELNIPHISTGDLFRENIKNKTKLGEEAQSYINQGKLVPDTLVLNMLFDRISQPDAQKGYLLDGFPRTVQQAQEYAKHEGDKVKPIVVYIEVSDSVLLERIAAREKIEGRADDSQEIAKKRLETYKEQTVPLIAYYSKQGNLHTIQGEASIESIRKQIENIVK